MSQALTVAFLNKKGGVGKTSTVHHLGGTLAKRGFRVLLLDADPQASLSQGLLGPRVVDGLDPLFDTIAGVFDPSGVIKIGDLVRPTPFANLSLIAGSEAADKWNLPEPWDLGLKQFVLRDKLSSLRGAYDLILIDCPPHISLWAWSALVAADGVVVPVQAEDYGAQGLRAVVRVIKRVREEANGDLALIGYLITMYHKALSVHATYEAHLRGLHAGDVFETMVPLAKDYKEAVAYRKPIVDYKPRSASATAIGKLADELLLRLEQRVTAVASRRVA